MSDLVKGRGKTGRRAPRKPPHAVSVPWLRVGLVGCDDPMECDDSMEFYREIYAFNPNDEIAILRRGLPFTVVRILSRDLGIDEKQVLQTLRIPRSTFARRVKNREPLSTEESERALTVAKLVAEAERIYQESGDTDAPKFDVQAWIGRWLERENQALGGQTPAEMLDTGVGRNTVLGLIQKMQSGAYA